MSNLTTASIVLSSVVLVIALVLAVVMWRAAERVADRRIRFLAAGFLILALKSATSIWSIHFADWHHEFSEMVGTVYDVALVTALVLPMFIRNRP